MSHKKINTVNSGVELWAKAKGIIPGGGQLLSKRSEMFLPEQWPSYYRKAKGAEVWDLDDNHYIDMSIMGMGTCILGYAQEDVNRVVMKAVEQGSMATLNCPEEVELAEKLLALHPWAEMVRFARTGGEACMIAARVARAASGKAKIAFCGYHGWGDWYLAANLADGTNLDQQLLPGLEPSGVPEGLKGTAIPFRYGDLQGLKKIVTDNKDTLGAIMMEFQRHQPLDLEFLKSVRSLADDNDLVLIFDEVTSGFRVRAGGMHVFYNIDPDMVVLGKAMGNGFPIAAVVGRKPVMQAAQKTFISSTYWTERIGFVAGLEVIRQFEQRPVAEHLKKMGELIQSGWEKIFAAHQWNIGVCGIAAAPFMTIQENNPLLIKTLFTQEMLKRGYLASNLIYVSWAHTEEMVEEYLQAAEHVFAKLAAAREQGRLMELLEGPVCQTGFKRLN